MKMYTQLKKLYLANLRKKKEEKKEKEDTNDKKTESYNKTNMKRERVKKITNTQDGNPSAGGPGVPASQFKKL